MPHCYIYWTGHITAVTFVSWYLLTKCIVSIYMNSDSSRMLLIDTTLILHTYVHCSIDMWVMSFEILIHITFHNDPFYLHVVWLFWAVLPFYSILNIFPYSVTLVVGGIPWVHQFNNFKGFFFTVSHVRHIIALISYSGSFPGHISARGMFGLVGTLDSRFMVAGRWLWGGRTAWSGYGIVICCVTLWWFTSWTWPQLSSYSCPFSA